MGEADPALQVEPITTYFRLLDEGGLVLGVICSTCLNFYDLAAQVEVGIVGGMTDIIESQRRAENVITL